MPSNYLFILLFSLVVLFAFICSYVSAIKENKKNRELLKDYKQLKEKMAKYDAYCNSKQDSLKKIFSDRKTAFPYVAALMGDYLTIDLLRLESIARNGNYYQRSFQAIRIVEIKKETSELLKEAKQYEYQLKYLLEMFPNLKDYLDFDDSINLQYKHNDDASESDPILEYISNDEYNKWSSTEKNQLALDRYIQSHHKSKWQIGRDYELSVGYQYEKKGYKVQYTGSLEGLADLGRDLIAVKDTMALVIQCKYWSTEKTIREKHIAQLYGSSLCYQIDHPGIKVAPLFITSTKLSDEAKSFAEKLKVAFVENFPFKEFPRIKCNIGHDEFGHTKIYHLPMDQQYDSTIIDKPGECLAFTVAEAESNGFRRAYKWHSN